MPLHLPRACLLEQWPLSYPPFWPSVSTPITPADFCGCWNHNGDDRPHVPKQFVKRPRSERFATFGQGRELPQQATLAHEDSASLRWIKTVGSKCRVGVYEVFAECPGRAAWPRITSIPYKR